MKIRPNYFVIPLIVISVALLGNVITTMGMNWYNALELPSSTPQGWFIGMVWTIIFVLALIASLLFWNKKLTLKFGSATVNRKSLAITILLIVNAALNVLWSGLFFGLHLIGWSIIEMIVLNLVNIALVVLFWKNYKTSAMLWLPYIIWVGFATYFAYIIFQWNVIV